MHREAAHVPIVHGRRSVVRNPGLVRLSGYRDAYASDEMQHGRSWLGQAGAGAGAVLRRWWWTDLLIAETPPVCVVSMTRGVTSAGTVAIALVRSCPRRRLCRG